MAKSESEEARQARAWLEALENPETKFTLGEVIGEGDSAVVRKATDSEGKLVAIKILEETENSVLDIYNEFKILTKINGNKRFPEFFGAYRTKDIIPKQVWIVMELCEEGDIQNLLQRLKAREEFLKEEIIAYILREVLLGLKDLHEESVIHGDIKASNILVCKNGDIKICDFGFAKEFGSSEEKVQGVIGSPYWIAPEVIRSERDPDFAYDSRADVWSLGITAAELGDLDAPISHVYAPRAIFQITQNPPPTLKRPSDWSNLYNDFIAECLEKNPDHRPFSAELIEHTFINDVLADHEHRIRDDLLHLLKDFRSDPEPKRVPEITVKSEMIKMDRVSVPLPLLRDDLVTLYDFLEESVVDTLSQRFGNGSIYTFLGNVLLMVNPFHEYPIYGPGVANLFKYRARCDNAPHIFAVADRAYQDMLHHQEIQNIILTGETGSGKTTAGKHILGHIANMTVSNKKMLEKILKVSTIMDAFGNAATIFNSNATRHSQYFELTFTKSGKLSGGIIWAFCLEKWRITNCGRNQSNFHIFYYLMDTLIAAGEEGKYFLEKDANYEYLPLNPSHTSHRNIEKFREVKEAFKILDFNPDEQETIVKILCSILLVGQIKFTSENETQIQNPEVVEKIAELLEVDDKKLKWTFTNYCVVTGGEAIRGKNNFQDAEETRDSLARSLYARLVDWIVNLINTKLSFTRLVFGDEHSLAILDIPGFECFAQDNTLDQFLINMTNEQMQYFYNQQTFVWEMNDYEKDGMSELGGYNYHDNREVLDAILSKPIGLLAFLDDETKCVREDCKQFLDQIENKLETRFIRVSDTSTFTVFHYSGQVAYDARNFVERNKNFLSPEVIQVLRDSKNSAVMQLFLNQMTKTGNLTISDGDVKKQTRWTSAFSVNPHQNKTFNTKSRGKYSQSRQMQTIASTMRNSLLEMLKKVSQGSTHFVRCLRSNLKSSPFTFDKDLIRYQIKALGIMDTLKSTQRGYSCRLKFAEFLRRYKFLAFDFNEIVEDSKDNCRLLLIRLKMEGWALGKTKVFLKYYNEEFLSRLYETQVRKVVKIQSLMRAFLARKTININVSKQKAQELTTIGKSKLSPAMGTRNKVLGNTSKKETSSTTKINDPQQCRSSSMQRSSSPNKGYTKVYSSYDSVSKQLINPTEDDDEIHYATPRDIAKVFEAKAKENDQLQFGARCKPSSNDPKVVHKSSSFNQTRGSFGTNKNGNVHLTSIPKTSELASSSEELNKMQHDFEEQGPHHFKAMLRKTNINSKDPLPPKTPPPMPLLKGEYNAETKAKEMTKKQMPDLHGKGIALSGIAKLINRKVDLIKEKEERKERNLQNINEDPRMLSKLASGGHIDGVELVPGLFIEGFIEDL